MALFIAPVQAEDQVNKVATWIVTPKAGHTQDFEASLKAHMAHRTEHNDPRTWLVYTPMTGDELNTYILRACCDTWADHDSYRDWSEKNAITEHWMNNVDQFVDDYVHHISSIDYPSSNWPEDLEDINYVGVTYFTVKTGHTAAFQASIEQLSKIAKDGGWDRMWAWGTAITGGNQVYLVSPYADYASMAPPEKSFAEFLAAQMDSPETAQQALTDFNSHIGDQDYKIYTVRADLSMAESE